MRRGGAAEFTFFAMEDGRCVDMSRHVCGVASMCYGKGRETGAPQYMP
ncbi:hypothetical protein C7S16_6439 [Burkholderia thailandensis]|uniref:Uncharacterized protein n=1 Tax=Burkholderia thailandensis TaxID=57975 RepID=A0AAW9CP47_BURTH|nr:hypothetical protein [Burkholderia thailandensis]MDW9251937.1 hypothetical protein [Burkholderia thailandensis]